ncbi:MAG: glycosyltransferase [Clostridiales bacterium]|nr:glycosyltransferase [Clostridiales bacterium]
MSGKRRSSFMRKPSGRGAMPELEFEYVFVDDGSKDGTLEIPRGPHAADPRVHCIIPLPKESA